MTRIVDKLIRRKDSLVGGADARRASSINSTSADHQQGVSDGARMMTRRVSTLVKGALSRKRMPAELAREVFDFSDLYVAFRVQGTVELGKASTGNHTLVSTTVPANLRHRLYGVRVECEAQGKGEAAAWLELVSCTGTAAEPAGANTAIIASLSDRRDNKSRHAWQTYDITTRAEALDGMPQGDDMHIAVRVRSSCELDPSFQISTRPATLTILFNNAHVL
jgi:hypothetical protein